ncbi:MAG: protein CapI, partial [Turicibacter sp.]|nr:protein CapI [Turicibacter sp.]
EFLPMQAGDVRETYADIRDLVRDTGFLPKTSLRNGLLDFVAWWSVFCVGRGE